MCCPKGDGFAPFWSENWYNFIDFAHFGLESAMAFKGHELPEWMNALFVSIPNE